MDSFDHARVAMTHVWDVVVAIKELAARLIPKPHPVTFYEMNRVIIEGRNVRSQ